MARRSWTELFFLDEATALAAGHRPCFYCRRADAEAFRAAWAAGNGVSPPRAAAIDAVLHGERLDKQSRTLENLATRDELERAYDTLEKSIEGSKESIKKVHDGAVTRELDMQRKLESRQAASEEVAAKHW